MSYTAQKLSRDDVQNRLRVDIVPGATLDLMMGVNAKDSCHFYGLWEKTLSGVAAEMSAEAVQEYLEQTATEEQKKTVLAAAAAAEEDKTEFAGRKVLLVEDNALNAEIAIELLQTIGLVVDWAENGQLGVERYRASEIDEYFAIFMDMQMPVMDGVTATKMIRQSNRSDHDMPIFAMTANTFASDRKNCRAAGMTGYIAKPVSIRNIADALNVIEE